MLRPKPPSVRLNTTARWVETFRSAGERHSGMSSSDGGGLMSSAGLVRYFDSEDDKGIRIDPKTIIAFSTLLGILVLMLNAFA